MGSCRNRFGVSLRKRLTLLLLRKNSGLAERDAECRREIEKIRYFGRLADVRGGVITS